MIVWSLANALEHAAKTKMQNDANGDQDTSHPRTSPLSTLIP